MASAPSKIYEVLDQLYRPEYENIDRLVFYSSFEPGDALLEHFYKATNLIDISNFFILICTPYDISFKLNRICEKVSSDPISFQSEIVDISDVTQKISNNFYVPDTICTEPWMHLEINNQGVIKPCCVSQQTIGNIKQNKLKEVFFGPEMINLRKQMLSGKKPPGCKKCWDLESRGLVSNRLKHLSLNKKKLLTKFISSPAIKSLDLKPGVVCNFKCRICGPDSSSMHVQELFRDKKIIMKLPEDWINSQYDQILNIVDDIENIDMYGGEPFLMKNLTTLIKELSMTDRARYIRLHYNSNGSIYPAFLIDCWSRFQHIDLHFSIDNLGERFEIERGGSWTEVEKNIKKLIDLKLPNLSISVMPTVSIMNILYLSEIVEWAKNLNLGVSFNFLHNPECLSITKLTSRAKQLVFEKYQSSSSPEIKNIVESIKEFQDSDGKDFVNFLKNYDKIRNENFMKTHFEIAVAMGYTY